MSSSEFFDQIASHFKEKLPVVAYRKPGERGIKALLQADDRLHILNTFSESGFVFAPFDSTAATILLKPNEILETSDLPISDTPIPLANDAIPKPISQPVADDSYRLKSNSQEKTSYEQLVAEAIDEIAKGSFQKVVLSRCLDVDSDIPTLNLFQRLLSLYPKAFCYFWYHPKVGLWMGATPEILLDLRHRRLTTMSLAGTQKNGETDNPIWGHKELEEQELVTGYILNALQGRVANLSRTPTETVRAGDLLHLRTKITGRLGSSRAKAGSFDSGSSDTESLESENRGADGLDAIVGALHPTPAVCGLPKKEALGFIIDNENYDREYYTGFLGELNLNTERQRNKNRKDQENQAYSSRAKTTTLFVNLRCMKLTADRAQIFVGGGITKDSDPEGEWEETVAKSKTMLKILE
ncbi:MAG: chorismate-binding protein [Pricia sp.]